MSSKQLAPFVSLGALALEDRQKDDFYATDPKSERQRCYKDGDFKKKTNKGSAMCYAWFIWHKGNHTEAPRIYWI